MIREHLADLGGPDNVSAAERSIVRRAAVLTTQLEQMERRFALAEGEASVQELDAYQRGANTLRRLLGAVGLERRQKNVGPTLGDLLRADIEERQRAADAEEPAEDDDV